MSGSARGSMYVFEFRPPIKGESSKRSTCSAHFEIESKAFEHAKFLCKTHRLRAVRIFRIEPGVQCFQIGEYPPNTDLKRQAERSALRCPV